FNLKGYIVIINEECTNDEDEMTLETLELSADDLEFENNVFEIYTSPDQFQEVRSQLLQKGYELEEAEITYIPQNYNTVSSEDEEKMEKLIEMLEEEIGRASC